MSPSSGKSVALSDPSHTARPWHAERLPEIRHRRLSVLMSPDSTYEGLCELCLMAPGAHASTVPRVRYTPRYALALWS